ncbi:hypothetical protein TL16_g00750 [Triparma laevis f. inornata]|uniref:Polycystin cation channel PKD1/PKD2 domain-containing protein n=1 Tax=Triparma laevis f. inornata TaxID=1714386 RepID=A0A9W7DPX7_9STRA|nr:hypothetical protein TL16_g00750 [Triparma laevis f. inornata]
MAFYRTWSEEFKEFALYLFFVILFCAVIFMPRNADPYFMAKGIRDTFTTNEFTYNIDFDRMTTKKQALDWFEDVLIPNLLPEEDYNGNELTKLEKQFITGYNKRLGTARIRTVKVQDNSCTVPAQLQSKIQECYATISADNQDKTDYWNNHTVIKNNKVTSTILDVPYMEGADASWYSPATKLTYPGGGQVIELDNDLANVTEVWSKVKSHDFLDSSTRAVFVNVNMYNANVDLVSATKFSIEFSSAGAVFTSSQIRCLPLIRPVRVLLGDGATSNASLTFTLELVFFGMVLMYILNEFRIIKIHGYVYLKNIWNQLEAINLFLFLVVMILRALSLGYIGNVYDSFAIDDTYLDLDWVVYFAKLVENVNAFNAVLTFLKLFKFVRENRRMSQLIDTVELASIDMGSIMVIILVIATGYGIAFHIAFGHAVTEYRDFAESLFTLFLATLGDFDMDELRSYNQVLGAFLFVTFIVIMFFVVISMFLAIVDSAYESVREQLLEDGGDADEMDPLTRDVLRIITAPTIIGNKIFVLFVGEKEDKGPSEEELEKRRKEEAKKLAEEEKKKMMSPEMMERQAKLKVEHDFKSLYDEAMGRIDKLKASQDSLQKTLNLISDNITIVDQGGEGEGGGEGEQTMGDTIVQEGGE